MKVNTDTGIISAQGYMEEELSNELRPLVKSMLQKDIVTRKQLKKEFCLAQAGLVCIEIVINVEFSGNSKLVIDSASFKQLMDMEDEY